MRKHSSASLRVALLRSMLSGGFKSLYFLFFFFFCIWLSDTRKFIFRIIFALPLPLAHFSLRPLVIMMYIRATLMMMMMMMMMMMTTDLRVNSVVLLSV
jgi:hypothetical protein